MKRTSIAIAIACAMFTSTFAAASSHREAPMITETPKVDGTDFYMFRSYEANRQDFVTFIANYIPLQDPNGGPNYFTMDPNAVYAINIDNDGDAVADMSFEFRFKTLVQDLTVPVNGVDVKVPLSNIGQFGTTPGANDAAKNVIETYKVDLVREGKMVPGIASDGGRDLRKPFDNIGQKSIPDYASYANSHIQTVSFRTCATDSRVFVGQRKEGFAVALGKVFDLVNLNPLGPSDGNPNELANKNVTSIAIEVPIACLMGSGNSPIIGAWTTASTPSHGGKIRQMSRLGAPLVNEVVIGLGDKDKFNASQPKDDAQFATYVTNPTLPELLQILFPGVQAPNKFPRTDLVAAFLTGLDGLNKPGNVVPAEMLRLNMSIPARPAASQENLGALAGDIAGFPNGRRPGDDVVDIELRVAMGVLLPLADAPSGQFPYTDGATVHATDFRTSFPYLNTPIPGATF